MGLANYLKETKNEMKHMNWPTNRQAVNYTLLVVVISVVAALVLAAADYVFSLGVTKFLLSR